MSGPVWTTWDSEMNQPIFTATTPGRADGRQDVNRQTQLSSGLSLGDL